MATSGSKTVAIFNNNQLNLVFSWWFNKDDQSVVNNTTLVRWNLKLVSGSVGHVNSTASKKWGVTVNGKKYSGTNTVGIKDNTSKTLASGTTSVTHDSDGKKTFSYSFSQELSITKTSTGEWIGTKTGSGTGTLTTIPRKSTLSVANGTLGTAQTLKVTRHSSGFTHTITAKCGSASTTICTKSTSTSIAFTPPVTWGNQNKTGMNVSVTYTITTYNGSTNLGSNSYTKTYAIPSYNIIVVAVPSAEDGFNYSKYGAYVQLKSKAKFIISATTKYGATIKSIITTVDGRTYTGSEPTTEILSSSGTLSAKIVATDSRGVTATITKNIKVLPYTSPQISSMSVIRSDANGNSSSSGAYLTVKFKANVSPLNNNSKDNNSATYTLKYKKSTASSYTSATLTDYKNNYSVTDGKYTFAADTGSSYNVELTVTDNFFSVKKSNFGSSIKKLWSMLKKGLGFAFGKVAELQNYLDVGFKTLFRDQVEFVNDKSIMGIDTDGTKYSALIPVSASGNTSLGYGLYKAGKGNTHIYGNKVQFYTNDGIYTNGNKVVFDNNKAMYGIKPDGVTEQEVLNPQNSSGNTVLGYGNYLTKNGMTNIYGHDVNIGVSNIATPDTFRPYKRKGDNFTITIDTAGYVTNGGKEVVFWIPISVPIIGSPTVTAASVNGFVLRQNNNYTHGSDWDSINSEYTYVKPSTYEVVQTMFNGFRIKATFSSTTNATNNTPIAVHWVGKVTFS